VLGDEEKDKEVFALRPMTCPFQHTNMNSAHYECPRRNKSVKTLRIRTIALALAVRCSYHEHCSLMNIVHDRSLALLCLI